MIVDILKGVLTLHLSTRIFGKVLKGRFMHKFALQSEAVDCERLSL